MAHQLTFLEREQLAQFRSQGLSPAEIGRRLGRHRSTISRELARNSDGVNYWGSRAHEKAQTRRRQCPRKLDDPGLLDYVRRGLLQWWSPEQIAGRSRRDFPRQPRRRLSHSTIYRWIAEPDQRSCWQLFLRFGRRRSQPETRGKLPARAEIRDRPDVVDERRRFGDWEGDTVVGKARRGALVTLLERKSGFAIVGKVQRLKARNVARSITRRFAILPPGLRRTLTLDNGKEFARHQRIAHATGIDTYFARPYHAWERGANESFNGLLRQFFPKGTDFAGTSPREVKGVLDLLNDRPRKRLGYRTPREVLGHYHPVAFQL
jgi:IS30 family transposase